MRRGGPTLAPGEPDAHCVPSTESVRSRSPCWTFLRAVDQTRIKGKQLWIQSCIDRRSFMPDNHLLEAVERWRKLPPDERLRQHIEAIPRHVANSMPMAEPADEARIREGLLRRIRQLGISNCVRDPEPYGSRAATGAGRSHTELAVAVRQVPHSHEVQLELHRPVCAYLTPVVWRMRNIQIGRPEAQAHVKAQRHGRS